MAIAVRVVRAGYVPDIKGTSHRVDHVGAALLILFLGLLAFALTNGEENGWTAPTTMIPLIVAVIAAVAFAFVERRRSDPLLQLRYFRHPRYFMAAAGMFIAAFVLLGFFFFFFSIFVQSPNTLAMSPIAAGAAVLPTTMIMFAFSVVGARLLAPYSFRWPITIGMAGLAVGCLLLFDTTNTSTYRDMWWKLAIIGLGLGLTFPLLPRVGLRLLPEEHAGQGSGVINACLFFGATIGVVAGGIAQSITIRATVASVIESLPDTLPDRSALTRTLTHGTPDAVSAALASLSPPATQALSEALRDIQDDAFAAAMLVCAAVSLVGALMALWLMRGPVSALHSAADLATPQSKTA